MTSEAVQKLRSAYGRGYHDAIRAMETKAGDQVNNARLADVERGITGLAAKVLEAVPKSEPWPLAKIVTEIRRTGGTAASQDVILGCLNTLKGAGLVREPELRCFERVAAKPAKPKKPVELTVVEAPAPEPAPAAEVAPAPPAPAVQPEKRDTLAKLADLSADVRNLVANFSVLADAIDDVAIEVEERMAKINADSQKLAQLRALLKGVGD